MTHKFTKKEKFTFLIVSKDNYRFTLIFFFTDLRDFILTF